MTPLLAALHVWSSLCALALCYHLARASVSPAYRFRMGGTEKDRAQNFGLVAFYAFGVFLDKLIVALPIAEWAHYAAIGLACITGSVMALVMTWRVRKWNP